MCVLLAVQPHVLELLEALFKSSLFAKKKKKHLQVGKKLSRSSVCEMHTFGAIILLQLIILLKFLGENVFSLPKNFPFFAPDFQGK